VTDCESSSLNRHQTDDPDRVRAKQVRSRKAEALREYDAVLRRLPVWYKGDYVSITNRRQMLSVINFTREMSQDQASRIYCNCKERRSRIDGLIISQVPNTIGG